MSQRFLHVEDLPLSMEGLPGIYGHAPCLAVPPAESPSTRNISQFSGLLSEQSANLPGKPEPESTVFRCTSSRALRAA